MKAYKLDTVHFRMIATDERRMVAAREKLVGMSLFIRRSSLFSFDYHFHVVELNAADLSSDGD